jgi:phosphatidylinositol alpha 1,6-mannosyltransferase
MNVVIVCDADRDAGENAETASALARHAPPEVHVQRCVGRWADGPRLLRDAIAAHPAVIHVQGLGSAGVWGLLAARYAGIPTVAAWDARPGTAIADVWRHRLLRRCARVLVPSTEIRDELLAQGYREQTLKLWRPGVDLDRFHPGRRRAGWRADWAASDHRPAVLYVASPRQPARIDLLKRIYQILRDHGVSHSAVIPGDETPPFGVAAPGDLAEVLATVDLAVAPAGTPSLPTFVAQAQACGVPVIVPENAGCTDLVASGQSGYLCRGNDPLEFAWRASLLLRDADRRRGFATAARRAAQRYAWSISVRRLARSWREATSTPAGDRRWGAAANVTQCLPPVPPRS